jgi:cycloeucalenol cycloisomerase
MNHTSPMAMHGKSTWFSANPSKAWGEKFFLIYSPVWMAIMGLTMVTGVYRHFGDASYLLHSMLIALPLVIVPLLIRNEMALGRRWYQTYWFKANLYIGVFNFFGNYFGSEYFFDTLGMVYNYPAIQWTLDAELLGSGEQKVPLIMYFMTQAYFMTYHASAIVVLRKLRSIKVLSWLFPVMVFVIGYFWAWMETRAMANPLIADIFHYKDMARMLAYGSIAYACYFVASFPIFYYLDEREEDNWDLLRTTFAGLSASMLTFYLLDFWAKWIGPLNS